MNKSHNYDHGWTLVEVLVGITVFVIFLLSLTRLLTYTIRAYNMSQAQVAIKKEARGAMDRIGADWHTCYNSTMASGTAWQQITFNRYVSSGGTNQMKTVTYAINANGTLSRQEENVGGGSRTTIMVANGLDPDITKSYFMFNDISNRELAVKLTFKKRVGTTEQSILVSSNFARRDLDPTTVSNAGTIQTQTIANPAALGPGHAPGHHPSRFSFETR